mmetsp:Transcript_48761/g.96573  ORF Transcript_48761/g.96573 Transcript_48761/m.96573 type:complete len:226 (-) Transcript_48761:34-711(-)
MLDVRVDGLFPVSAALLLIHNDLLHSPRIVTRVVARRPPRVPSRVALPVLRGVTAFPLTCAVGALVPAVLPPAAAAAAAPAAPSATAAATPLPAAASAGLFILCLFAVLLFLGLMCCNGRLRLASRVPDPALNRVPQVAPKAQFWERLHDHGPTASNTVVKPLCFSDGSAVQQAQELCAVPFRGAVVSGPDRSAGVKLQQLVFVEPLHEQLLHLRVVVHAAATES